MRVGASGRGLLAVLVAVGLGCSSGGGSGRLDAFSLKTMDGGRVGSSECVEKVCMLAVWATWCPPCREEMPELNALAQEFGDRVLVLGISVDEDVEDIRGFLEKNTLAYPVAIANEKFLKGIGFTGILPTVVVLGPDGEVLSRYLGTRTTEFLRRELQRHLGDTARRRAEESEGASGV